MWTDGSPHAAPSLEYTGLRYVYSFGRQHNFENFQHFGTTEINPLHAHFESKHKGSNCTTLVLLNLKRSEIFLCNCKQKINYHVVCSVEVSETFLAANYYYPANETGCHIFAVKRNQECYHIKWNNGENCGDFCSNRQMKHFLFVSFKQLDFITEAVSISPFLLIYAISSDVENILHYNQKRATYVQHTAHEKYAKGFQVCNSPIIKTPKEGNMFQCKNGTFISMPYYCDQVTDCLDSSDEANCFLDQNKQISSHLLVKRQKARHINKCISMFYKDIMNSSVRCSKFLNDLVQTTVSYKVTNRTYFQCNDSSKIPYSQVDDLHFDCSKGDDEFLLQNLMRFGIKAKCTKNGQIPCRLHHSICYEVHQVCVYQLGETNHLVPCRDGNHLETCTKFECNMMLKCDQYYCIPWEYVCDNKWDCPRGTDEGIVCDKIQSTCKNMYKCKNTSNTCIHVGNTCDDNFNCPLKDDEYLCELKHITCPNDCSCLLFALVCDGANFTSLPGRYPQIFVAFRNVTIQLTQIVEHFHDFSNLEFIDTDLTDICQLQVYSQIYRMVITHNIIGVVNERCLSDPMGLVILVLSHNHIFALERKALINLVNLRQLDLSFNNLTSFSSTSIVGTEVLEILSLQENKITSIYLNNLVIRDLQVTSFHLCCFYRDLQKCTTIKTTAWYDSCEFFMTTSVKIMTMILGCSIICLNFISVVLLLHEEKISEQYIILARSVFLSEALWGVYLVTMWIDAVSYGQAVSQKVHQSSPVCHALVYLSFTFFIIDPAAAALLAFGRFRLTKNPMETKFKQTVFCKRCVAAMYSSSIFLTCACGLVFELTMKQFSSILCLPFVDPSNTQLSRTAATIFSSSFQLCVSICVTACHYQVVKNVKESNVATQSPKANTTGQKSLRTKLICITTHNVVYWLALSTMFTTTKFLNKYSLFAFTWVVFTVVSFNPILNPGVNLLTAAKPAFSFCKKNLLYKNM